MTYIECPEGQEQGPAIEDVAPYCVPADEANPGEQEVVEITLPVEPPDYVEPLPPALPLDPLPEVGTPLVVVPVQPAPRELAETGSADALNILVLAAILFVAGLATWATRRK